MRKQESRGGSPQSGLGGYGRGRKERGTRTAQPSEYSRSCGRAESGSHTLSSGRLCALLHHLFTLDSAIPRAMFSTDAGALGTSWDFCSSFV